MKTITEADVVAIFRRLVEREGGQNAAARRLGISASYMSDILNGRRAPSAHLLNVFGIERRTVYVKR